MPWFLFPVSSNNSTTLSSLPVNCLTSIAKTCDSLRIPVILQLQPKWSMLFKQFPNYIFQWRYGRCPACCSLYNVQTKGEFSNCLGWDSHGDGQLIRVRGTQKREQLSLRKNTLKGDLREKSHNRNETLPNSSVLTFFLSPSPQLF